MQQPTDNPPTFFCDAMLGGLARWLRAAGYDAEFRHGIDDSLLVAEALDTGRILLSSDGPMFERKIIRDGQLKALFIPRQLTRTEQLAFVAGTLLLKRLPARCMACGGRLQEIPKHTVMDEAPPLAYRSCDVFFRCTRCGKLLWRGTHWRNINARLSEILKSQGK
jgi:uncharacterized protein